MNKTTLVLLVVLVGLGVTTWLVSRPPETVEIQPLKLKGYATEEQLEAEKKKGMFESPEPIPYPMDEIIIGREGETIHLVREGEGKDETWRLTEPVKAAAVKYAVKRITDLFKEDMTSVFAKKIKPEDFPLYDLEPDRRISATVKAKGVVYEGFDLIIGKAEEPGDEALPGADRTTDTWVLKAGDESTIYRIGSADLRTPFAQELSDFRDKKLFDIEAGDLVELSITDPNGAVVKVVGDRKETPAPDPEGKGDKPPKVETTWKIAQPAGYLPDSSVDSTARSLANLRAKEFVAPEDAPTDALAGKLWRIDAKTHDGKELQLDVSDVTSDEGSWARVPGSGELIKLDKWAANNVRKTVADLRDRKLFGVQEADVTQITFAPEEGGPVTVAREGDTWRFVQPASPAVADPSSDLRSIVDARAARFARSDEAAEAAAALAHPDFVFSLKAGEGQVWRLEVGAKLTDDDRKNNRFARVTGPDGKAGEAMLLQDYVTKRFRKGFGDLRSKKVVAFAADDVARVEVRPVGGGAPVTLERPAEGGDLVLVDIPEGKTAKAAAIKALAGTLPNLRAKSFYDGKKPADVGLGAGQAHVVTVTLSDGTSLSLSISKQKDGTDPYATTSGGPLAGQVFTINSYQAQNLLKPANELVE